MNTAREQTLAAFRLNLEQQKSRAKDLLRDAKGGDATALARITGARTTQRHGDRRARDREAASAGTPPANPTREIKLAAAQFAIARELRFESWARLKTHIESMDRQRAAIRDAEPAPDGDLKTLHIRCGHDIQHTLAEGGFTGDFLAHVYPYCRGPVTRGPDALERRAQFVSQAYGNYMGAKFESALQGERDTERRILSSATDYERVVLWMEHDSYDQLVLVRTLALYASTGAPRVLELITLNEFPGGMRFIGLGQLPAEALRLLWPRRPPLPRPTASWSSRASSMRPVQSCTRLGPIPPF